MKSGALAALHSSTSAEHFTPPHVVELAREVLGGIELDPASCHVANRTIKAREYFSFGGLSRTWRARSVFLNPPGGKDEAGESLAASFWWKLAEAWQEGLVDRAFFVMFSVSQLQVMQRGPRALPIPLDFPFCVPSSRIDYWAPVGDQAYPQGSPTHASAFFLLPPWNKSAAEVMTRKFQRLAAPLGRVTIPTRRR